MTARFIDSRPRTPFALQMEYYSNWSHAVKPIRMGDICHMNEMVSRETCRVIEFLFLKHLIIVVMYNVLNEAFRHCILRTKTNRRLLSIPPFISMEIIQQSMHD